MRNPSAKRKRFDQNFIIFVSSAARQICRAGSGPLSAAPHQRRGLLLMAAG
ncbi:hypothetical protein [Hoeflea alexandrii]|jgi:hypothetical protein|uniref:hypothetical protein n=1 Tax=Hoeflea alexandrii TaxID=288436 RepID=UPI0036D3BC03|tara:strand:+ start:1250 stop:1402 length:153 start_codon:yes stop_codon:yes gene_type:complete